MPESSENNELRFQQQKHPSCLCNVCLDLVMQTYHLQKTNPADIWGLTAFTVGRIREKKRPHPVYVCFCRSGLSSNTRCNTNSSGRNSLLHLLHPAWQDTAPGAGSCIDHSHSNSSKALVFTQALDTVTSEASTQAGLRTLSEAHQGRCGIGGKQCRGQHVCHTESSD